MKLRKKYPKTRQKTDKLNVKEITNYHSISVLREWEKQQKKTFHTMEIYATIGSSEKAFHSPYSDADIEKSSLRETKG